MRDHLIQKIIIAVRLKFNAFKAFEGEKVNGIYTRLKCLLNDIQNNEVRIPSPKVNATFVNSLSRKWLSTNQTQRANNSIKNDSMASLFGKYNYEEGPIDQVSHRFGDMYIGYAEWIRSPVFKDILCGFKVGIHGDRYLQIVASIEQYSDLSEMTLEEAIGRLTTTKERISTKATRGQSKLEYCSSISRTRAECGGHGGFQQARGPRK
ncbi:hypothetical protein Tco_0564964 [Tanacetum coccineum]